MLGQDSARSGPGNRDVNRGGYGAVSVKWFPKQADHGDIKEFLVGHGLPHDHSNVNIKDNGQVIISDLTSELCQELADNITGQKFKNKKMIYCQPILLATPHKVPACSANSTPFSSIAPVH